MLEELMGLETQNSYVNEAIYLIEWWDENKDEYLVMAYCKEKIAEVSPVVEGERKQETEMDPGYVESFALGLLHPSSV